MPETQGGGIAPPFHNCARPDRRSLTTPMRCLCTAGSSLCIHYIGGCRSKLNSYGLRRISAAPETAIESFDECLFPTRDWPQCAALYAPLTAEPARPV